MRMSEMSLVEGAKVPWFYGIAYRDYSSQFNIFYPIPFNLIVSYARKVWFSMRRPVQIELLRKAYESGRRRMHKQKKREIEILKSDLALSNRYLERLFGSSHYPLVERIIQKIEAKPALTDRD